VLTVFRNGSVFDGRSYLSRHGIVVSGDRVLAVLADDDLPVGDAEVDLAGGLVAPGFVDAHVHAVQGGLERIRCDLTGWHSRGDYLAAIASYAGSRGDVGWVLGGGWAMAAFPGASPTAVDLDQVVPDRPAFLVNRDHHGAWVNSRALELAGVDAETPDPSDGRLDRDPDGRPTGMVHEGAMDLFAPVLPAPDPTEYDAGLLEGQRYLHSFGVTGWQDAILGEYGGIADPSDAYLRAATSGALTATVVGALWWDRERGLDQMPDLVERRRCYTHGRLAATTVKIMQDGIAENGTAAMLTPYLDRCGHATTNRGHSFVDAGRIREAVIRLDAEDFQVHVHAIGDRGVREALDAFEYALHWRGSVDETWRHHIAHVQVIHPGDRPRFGELGVAANLQALWACHDDQMVELTLPFLGAERARWQYPFADLHRTGARLVMGSDWPVTTPDPLAAIHVAVNRTAYGASGREGEEPFLPEQALDLRTAFAAYTSGSAWVNGRDDAGTLASGRVADLVVLDRDPFEGPTGEIGATRVVSTWVDGRSVFAG